MSLARCFSPPERPQANQGGRGGRLELYVNGAMLFDLLELYVCGAMLFAYYPPPSKNRLAVARKIGARYDARTLLQNRSC